MAKYRITFITKTGKLLDCSKILEYDTEGVLIATQVNIKELKGEYSVARPWVASFAPDAEHQLTDVPAQQIRVERIPDDLSFNAFWEAYGYKIGKKERALKAWTALDDSDRLKVFKSIPQYNGWLSRRPTIEKLYPETFLNQKRWENDFNR